MQKEGEIYRCRNAWHVHVLLMGRLRHSVNTVNTAVQCPAQTDRVCGDRAFPLETAAGGPAWARVHLRARSYVNVLPSASHSSEPTSVTCQAMLRTCGRVTDVLRTCDLCSSSQL